MHTLKQVYQLSGYFWYTQSVNRLHGGVAHRLEQAAHNHLVVGSIPTTPTIEMITAYLGCFYFSASTL